MKVLPILLTIFTISSAFPKAEPENCPECRKGVNTYFTAWNSGDGLHIGEQHLIEIVCPEMSDPELCETLVLTYWEKIAQIIFSERGAGRMCHHIDPQCEKPSMRTWDLDTCITTTSSMLRTLISPELAVAIVNMLKGEGFCEDPSMAFTDDQIIECHENIGNFMPPAMKALFSRSDPRQLCCFYFDGLCG